MRRCGPSVRSTFTDPARPQCGSAHCSMVPYWLSVPASSRLPPTDGGWTHSTSFKSLQGGPRQGSLVARWDKEAGLVALAGSARIVMKGELLV